MQRVILAFGLASAALLACYSGPHVDPDGPADPALATASDGTDPEGGDEDAAEAPAPSSSAASPAPSAPVCTSKQTWTLGDRKSKLMHPGVACIECHTRKRAPRYSFAGTVFPTLHEKDDCYGAATAGQVVVTDARGVVATATLNAAGNFYSATKLTPPLRAKVVIGGKERVMKDPADSGDCNSCHTATGKNDAEGRIIGP